MHLSGVARPTLPLRFSAAAVIALLSWTVMHLPQQAGARGLSARAGATAGKALEERENVKGLLAGNRVSPVPLSSVRKEDENAN